MLALGQLRQWKTGAAILQGPYSFGLMPLLHDGVDRRSSETLWPQGRTNNDL